MGLTPDTTVLRFGRDARGDGVDELSALRAVAVGTRPDGSPGSVDLGDVVLEGSVRLEGRVEDATGTAVAGATIVVVRSLTDLGGADADPSGDVSLQLSADGSATSVLDGAFGLDGLVRGSARVFAFTAVGAFAGPTDVTLDDAVIVLSAPLAPA